MPSIVNSLRKMKFITLNREVHKWAGIVLSVFVLIITVTGFVLIHKKTWTWMKTVDVPQALVPGWASQESARKAKDIKALAFVPSGHESQLVAATPAGLFAQDSQGWRPAGMPPGRVEVTSLLMTEDRWFLGTHKGLFESEDRGVSWTSVSDESRGLPSRAKITAIARHPVTGAIFLGTKMGPYQSTDGGLHWIALSDRFPYAEKQALDEEALEKAREVMTIAFDPQQPSLVYFGTHHGLYRYDRSADTVSALDLAPVAALAGAAAPTMTLDKYLTDLHTGKLFGDKLWTLYDLTAFGLALFVVTGLYIWIYPKSVKWKKEREQAQVREARLLSNPPATGDRPLPHQG
jgi:hypothetical protein